MKYLIYVGDKFVGEVMGDEVAIEAYKKACELADVMGTLAMLVDGETGVVLAMTDDFDDYDYDYEPIEKVVGIWIE